MTTSDPNNFSTLMREALAAEIDPDETLRWAGQPDARRTAAWALRAGVVAMLFLTAFGIALVFVGLMVRSELMLLRVDVLPDTQQSWTTVWGQLMFGSICTLIGLIMPFAVRSVCVRRARHTVYALTNTRVFMLYVGRTGNIRVQSVEPGHPLRLTRVAKSDGIGDLTIHTVPNRSGGMLLLSCVADARTVERLIRTTFDPPK